MLRLLDLGCLAKKAYIHVYNFMSINLCSSAEGNETTSYRAGMDQDKTPHISFQHKDLPLV